MLSLLQMQQDREKTIKLERQTQMGTVTTDAEKLKIIEAASKKLRDSDKSTGQQIRAANLPAHSTAQRRLF